MRDVDTLPVEIQCDRFDLRCGNTFSTIRNAAVDQIPDSWVIANCMLRGVKKCVCDDDANIVILFGRPKFVSANPSGLAQCIGHNKNQNSYARKTDCALEVK